MHFSSFCGTIRRRLTSSSTTSDSRDTSLLEPSPLFRFLFQIQVASQAMLELVDDYGGVPQGIDVASLPPSTFPWTLRDDLSLGPTEGMPLPGTEDINPDYLGLTGSSSGAMGFMVDDNPNMDDWRLDMNQVGKVWSHKDLDTVVTDLFMVADDYTVARRECATAG
jgi:hypothetical protein